MSQYLGFAAIVGALVAGCASAPEVTYTSYDTVQDEAGKPVMTGKDVEGSIKFYLSGSVVTLTSSSARSKSETTQDQPPKPATKPGATLDTAPATTPSAVALPRLRSGDQREDVHPAGAYRKCEPSSGSTAKGTPRLMVSVSENEILASVKAAPTTICNVQELPQMQVGAVITATPYKGKLYALTPIEHAWYKPNISVTYFDNSNLIKVLGADAQDDRIKFIQAIGGGLAVLAAGAASPEPPATEDELQKRDNPLVLPLAIDLSSYDFDNPTWIPVEGNEGWQYMATLKVDIRGTQARDTFFKNNADQSTRAFPFSSCQDGELRIRKAKGIGSDENKFASYQVRIADPRNIQTLLIPNKGSINMHSVCGADLTTQQATKSSEGDIFQEIVKQVQAIRQAQKGTAAPTSSKPGGK